MTISQALSANRPNKARGQPRARVFLGGPRAQSPARAGGQGVEPYQARDFLPEPELNDKKLLRHRAFFGPIFEGEGAYFFIQSPHPEALSHLKEPKKPEDLTARWFDVDYRVREHLWGAATKYYAGDALPVIFLNFGCGNLAALLGTGYRLAEETIWFDDKPLAEDLESLPELTLQRDHPLRVAVRETSRELSALSGGRYFLGVTDIGANLDILTSLVPRQTVLKSLARKRRRPSPGPGQGPSSASGGLEGITPIDRAMAGINMAWRDFFEDCRGWIATFSAYISSFTSLVYPGRWYKLMSESSVMISAQSFAAHVRPALQWQIDELDRAIFNLDGLGQAHLLSEVLALRGLSAIEWNPVPEWDQAHEVFIKDYLSAESLKICRAIQSAGRKLIVTRVAPFQVEPLLAALRPDGLLLSIDASSKEEADRIDAYTQKFRRA